MKFTGTPRNVCSSQVSFDLTDGIVSRVQFQGGCHGNLQGIARLVEGMPAKEAIARLRGVRCGQNFTSCPDQFAQILEQALEQMQK